MQNLTQASDTSNSKIAIVLPTQSTLDTNTNKTELKPQTLEEKQHQAAIIHTQQICNQEALETLKSRTNYPIIQENGQRKYGPPPNWTGEEPDRSCEVFVGKIPRDCFEDELVPILERAGTIYEFRLMMEYSGYNRGYGFVMFTSRDQAKRAVSELNNFEIRKNRMIGLCRSVDNCRLFVGGIPKNKKREEILEEMKKVTDDVVNVIVYPSANDKSKNRGFAFVQYTNHRAAAVARRKLIPARIHLFGQPIAVDWAEPEPEVDDDVMKTVKVLYVRNLMLTTSEEQIKAEFEAVKAGSVERVKKMKDFAFVHFKEREDALFAMKKLDGSTIDGALVEVSLSKPVDKNNYMRFPPQLTSPTQQQLLAQCMDPADLNLLLASTHSINHNNPQQLQHAQNIPFLPQTVAFTDPATNLQYQIPNHHFQTLAHMQPMQNFATNSNISCQQLQSPILSQNQMLVGIGNLLQDPNSLNLTNIKPPGGRGRTTAGSRGAGGIHRSVYYNTIKGVNGGVKRQLSGEDSLHDFYAGVKPVPMLPLNTNGFKYPIKAPSQILEEVCLKGAIPPPIYTLHTTGGKDQEGREMALFLYKVMIPALFGSNQLSSNRLVRTLEDAKNDAAEFVLMQIYPQGLPPPHTTDFNEATYNQQNQQTLPQNSINPLNKTSLVSENDPLNSGMLQQTAGVEIQPMQYILDPSGQYLMYPTPGWQWAAHFVI